MVRALVRFRTVKGIRKGTTNENRFEVRERPALFGESEGAKRGTIYYTSADHPSLDVVVSL